MIIEVLLCEDCGQDARIQRRAQLPACSMCGSRRVSRCEREQTPQEIQRVMETLNSRRGGNRNES
jgi:predicted RNA-binding Zn-ribbon protein involved in translation (DUF1610 family)